MIPLFFPVFVTLIPAPLISVFAGAATEASSKTISSSLTSTLGILLAGGDASCPLADAKEVPVCGTPWGGELDRDRVANEDNAAAADWIITGLQKKIGV